MSNAPNDDLFEETKMTFGEHLEELRVALFKSMFGIVFGLIIAIFFAANIVKFIQVPLRAALEDYYLTKASKELVEKYKKYDMLPPPELLAMIKDYGLVPSFLPMEAEGILAALRAADPVAFGQVDFKPHRYLLTDIKPGQLARLCKRLVREHDDDGSPVKEMWELLSAEQRKSIEQIAKKSTGNDVEEGEVIRTNLTPNADEAAVLAILNELAESPKLVQSDVFSKLDGSIQAAPDNYSVVGWINRMWFTENIMQDSVASALRTMRKKLKDVGDDPDAATVDQIRRLNKLLFASVFSDCIGRPSRTIIDVPIWKQTDVRVQTLNAHEAFMIWLKAAFIGSLVLSSPWIFWQIWNFVAAGLYPHEKNYVYIYLPFSLGLFIAGAGMAFFFVFEPVLQFLFSFNKLMEVDPDPRISEWLSFVLFLPLGFGLAFQLPLVMLFTNRIGVFTIEAFLEKWRIAILVIFVISMLLTPADPISMLLMALPLTVLYFLGIVLCKWMPKGRNPFFDEAYEP